MGCVLALLFREEAYRLLEWCECECWIDKVNANGGGRKRRKLEGNVEMGEGRRKEGEKVKLFVKGQWIWRRRRGGIGWKRGDTAAQKYIVENGRMSDGWMGKKVRKMTGRNAVNQQVLLHACCLLLVRSSKEDGRDFSGRFSGGCRLQTPLHSSSGFLQFNNCQFYSTIMDWLLLPSFITIHRILKI